MLRHLEGRGPRAPGNRRLRGVPLFRGVLSALINGSPIAAKVRKKVATSPRHSASKADSGRQ